MWLLGAIRCSTPRTLFLQLHLRAIEWNEWNEWKEKKLLFIVWLHFSLERFFFFSRFVCGLQPHLYSARIQLVCSVRIAWASVEEHKHMQYAYGEGASRLFADAHPLTRQSNKSAFHCFVRCDIYGVGTVGRYSVTRTRYQYETTMEPKTYSIYLTNVRIAKLKRVMARKSVPYKCTCSHGSRSWFLESCRQPLTHTHTLAHRSSPRAHIVASTIAEHLFGAYATELISIIYK